MQPKQGDLEVADEASPEGLQAADETSEGDLEATAELELQHP